MASDTEPPPRPAPVEPDQFRGKLSAPELIEFFELLAQLVRARVDLPEALRAVAAETSTPKFRELLTSIANDNARGQPLGDCLRRTKAFPEFFVGMIDSGLAANDLHAVLLELSRECRSQRRFRDAFWAQMFSPIQTSFAMVGMIAFLAFWNLPGAMLEMPRWYRRTPLAPRVLKALCNFAQSPDMIYLLIGAGVAAIALALLWKRTRFRAYVQGATLAPLSPRIVSSTLRFLYLGRVCRLMALFLRRRMPLDVALVSASQCFSFLPVRTALKEVAVDVSRGQTLDQAMKPHQQVFPPTFLQFIAAALMHGEMAQTLDQLGESYEERAEDSAQSLRFYIYLGAMLVLAALIIFLAMAVFGTYMPWMW